MVGVLLLFHQQCGLSSQQHLEVCTQIEAHNQHVGNGHKIYRIMTKENCKLDHQVALSKHILLFHNNNNNSQTEQQHLMKQLNITQLVCLTMLCITCAVLCPQFAELCIWYLSMCLHCCPGHVILSLSFHHGL
jgi:hypothetical protein